MATRPPNLVVRGKGLEEISRSLRLLATVEVLVGVPAEETDREDEDSGNMTNAALLYIHENGMPEQNIPSRPSLGPAIAENTDTIADDLGRIAKRVLHGNPGAVEAGYHILGTNMASAVRNKINDGIAPGLAPSTLRKRARKGRKGAAAELERRKQPGTSRDDQAGLDLAKPLVDTAEMRNAITYAIRQKERS